MNVRKHIFNFVALFVGLAFGYLGTQVDAAAAFIKKWTPNLALMTLEAAEAAPCIYTIGWTHCPDIETIGCWAFDENGTTCNNNHAIVELLDVWGCKEVPSYSAVYKNCGNTTSQYIPCYDARDCVWTGSVCLPTGDSYSNLDGGGPNGYVTVHCD